MVLPCYVMARQKEQNQKMCSWQFNQMKKTETSKIKYLLHSNLKFITRSIWFSIMKQMSPYFYLNTHIKYYKAQNMVHWRKRAGLGAC